MKMEGPFGKDEPGVIFYLKRQIEICEDAILIAPSSRYVQKLVGLLKISDRRPRTTPNAPELDIYDPESIHPDDNLSQEQNTLYRSTLGICLYVAQEKFDIQHCVRVLSSYMSSPTEEATNSLKKLVSYLQSTSHMKIKFERVGLRSPVFHRWNNVGMEEHNLIEAFSDSDWGSSRVSRRRTSCGMIFLNGCRIYSHCRAQQSVSLLSMEAKVLAATGLLAEAFYLKQVIPFAVRCVVELSGYKRTYTWTALLDNSFSNV